jgi:hypothetical protein
VSTLLESFFTPRPNAAGAADARDAGESARTRAFGSRLFLAHRKKMPRFMRFFCARTFVARARRDASAYAVRASATPADE